MRLRPGGRLCLAVHDPGFIDSQIGQRFTRTAGGGTRIRFGEQDLPVYSRSETEYRAALSGLELLSVQRPEYSDAFKAAHGIDPRISHWAMVLAFEKR